MSEDKKACSDTRCPMTRGGVCNVCGADVPKGFGEPSLHHELVAALEVLQQSSSAIAVWLNHWDVPFSEEDEWSGPTGDRKLFFDALNQAAVTLQKAKQGDKP